MTDLVKRLEVTDRRRRGQIIWELVLEVSDEHPELSAPVSNVVQPETGQKTNLINEHNQDLFKPTLLMQYI